MESKNNFNDNQHDYNPAEEKETEEKGYYGNPSFTNRGMFRRPFSFKGRIRRLEYVISYIIYWVWASLFQLCVSDLGNSDVSVLSAFFLLTVIPMVWFIIAQGCKRCHDIDNCGWWQLVPFYWLFMLFGNSEQGDNEYGDNPKGDS